MSESLIKLKQEIRQCRLCEANLPLGPNPVFRGNASAKILIAGQAPGTAVHKTSIPFNDPSGVRLRQWMGVSNDTFYNEDQIAIIPMGFCYPGKGKSGDLPPRPECAETWRKKLLLELPNIQLVLAIGQYAQAYHLAGKKQKTLTETVKNWRQYMPAVLPLPHPSPRNNIWLKRNPWFEEVIKELQKTINRLLY